MELVMAACLEADGEPDLADFGGMNALAAAAGAIASSPLMPEFLKMSLPLLADEQYSDGAAEFVCRCIEGATHDFVWTEAVDILDAAIPLPAAVEERCFARFLAVASDRGLQPMARAAGLDGALRWAGDDRRRQLKLSVVLLDLEAGDSPDFLARAAKVMGVAYSHWHEPSLVNGLLKLLDVEGVADEAAFELGMAKLADGLEADDRITAASAFASARQWLQRAAAFRELRPDARLYVGCLETLISFSHGGRIDELARSVSADAFAFHAWCGSDDEPSWLGARRAEAVTWSTLALKLKELAGHLDSAAWWEPVAVIEEHLLAAYCAGRAILKRGQEGGVEAVVRPWIEASIAKERYQAQLVKTWLSRNAASDWRPEAEALVSKIDALMSEDFNDRPHEAATEGPTVAALVNRATIPPSVKAAIADAISVHVGNMTGAEMTVIEICVEAARACSDYRENAAGTSLFHAVLMWTVRFLASRLDLTKGDVPSIGYLFERPGGILPHEGELQADYYALMVSNLAGTEIEVSNVGGGRADLRFSCRPERLVVEIKRESEDASFDALERHYAAQTTDYQNVSVRLGFLLVLDQTELRLGGTPHLRELVKPCMVLRDGETEERLVVVVKVPGRRLRPSDLTKAAKSASRNAASLRR